MKRQLLAVSAVVLMPSVLAAGPTPASAGEVPDPTQGSLRAYPTCNAAQPGPPTRDHSCRYGQSWGTILLYPDDGYLRCKVCIRRPDDSQDCYRWRTAAAAAVHREEVGMAETGDDQTGRFVLTWKVEGRGVVDRDSIRVREPRGFVVSE